MRRESSIVAVFLIAAVAACALGRAQGDRQLMSSALVDWGTLAAKETKTGARRQFFQAPTATLDELEGHATTINPGESPHPPHQHPEEELMIVKEGTVEVLVGGATRKVGPGSVVFQASNQLHGLRNVGATPATYHVFRWKSPGGPQPAKGQMSSTAFEWGAMKAKREKYGARRQLFQSPTATLEELESHVTTLDAGQATGGPHRHPEEALVIVKEGTVEVLYNDEWRRVGPGSIVFEGSNQLHGVRNGGATQAVYHVVKWRSRRTPKAAAAR